MPEPKPVAKSKKAPKGTGTTITIDLAGYPDLLAKIKEAAKADDRETSKYVRRLIVLNEATLFPASL